MGREGQAIDEMWEVTAPSIVILRTVLLVQGASCQPLD